MTRDHADLDRVRYWFTVHGVVYYNIYINAKLSGYKVTSQETPGNPL